MTKFTDFSAQSTIDGSKIKLSKVAGKGYPVVIIVFATDVAESKSAVQAAEEVAASKDHIRFIALNVEDDLETTQDWMLQQGIKSVAGFWASKIPKGYGIREGSYPHTIVIDESGKVLESSEDYVDYASLVG